MASLLDRALTIASRAARAIVTDIVAKDAQAHQTPPTSGGSTGPQGCEAPPGTKGSAGASSRAPRSPHGPAAAKPSRPRPSASSTSPRPAGPATGSTRTPASRGVAVYDAASRGLPDFSYSPDPDGNADPGEVVWTWVPFEEDPTRGKDRPVLVLARRDGRLVVAQMTSKDHDRDASQEARHGRYWHDVGAGSWDSRGRPSEVRLDRLLSVPPEAVRREGATMDRGTFDGVAAALKEHWS